MSWLHTITIWYLYLFVVGIVFIPFTKKIFGQFFDYGYPFAKTIGILVLSYTVFLLGIFKILPFSRESLLFVLVIFGFLNYRKFNRERLLAWTREPLSKKLFWLTQEVLFFISLVFLAFIRGQEPSIRGLEKFMDYGFMNSVLRSTYFPPLDIWLSADPTKPAGYPINYYYFGHLTGALLIKLSNISPHIGYNLVLATILAQGMTLAFSLSANVVFMFQKFVLKLKAVNVWALVFYGLVGSFLVNLAGNLHTIYLFTNGYPNESPVPFWGIFQSLNDVTKSMSANNQNFFDAMFGNSKYWYPNATRFIPFTIHEFPAYSYVVADLHGHVFDIPFVILTLALLFVFTIQNFFFPTVETWTLKFRQTKLLLNKLTVYFMIGIGFLLAVHYMTNVLDAPIYLLLTVIILFYIYKLSLNFIAYCLLAGTSFVLFSQPFSHYFSPFVSGIGLNCSPGFLVNLKKLGPFLFEKDNCQLSPIWMLFVLWGFFWLSALLLVSALVFLQKNKKDPKQKNLITPIDHFMLIIFGFGTFMILIPEFFYIKDIYPAHFRANTMFKLGYQAFMMMSIASAYVLFRLKLLPSFKKYITVAIYSLFFLLVFLYPFFAFPGYYPGLYDIKTYQKAPELDGSKWLASQYPEDLEIINYINERILGQPIILEAQGDSYTDYERISAYTGLPTVAGWWVHEWLWRGSADVVGNRLSDITNMYESKDYQLTRDLLKKYKVSYIILSELEKSKYPNLQKDKFSEIGVKIFETDNGSGALYQVK